MKFRTYVLTTFYVLTIIIMKQNVNATPKTSDDFKVEVRNVNEIHMVYYEFTGSYHKTFNDFGNLMQYVQYNQLPMEKYSIGIFYDDPSTVAEDKLRSEAGFMVQKPVKVSDGYMYKKIEAFRAVSVRYKSMEEIMHAYTAASNYISTNKLETEPFSIEIYYSSDPNVIDAEILFLIKE